MSDFIPIPDYPGYSISPQGQVRSERSGLILSHDARGRVKLRAGKKYPAFFVGELLAMAGCLVSAPAPVAAPAHDERVAKLEKSLDLARRANGHLLALVAQLRAEIAAPAKAKGKKAKRCVTDDDSVLQSLNFDDELWP